MHPSTRPISYDEWLTGDALAAGRVLMESLPPPLQVARAVAVLDIFRAHLPPVPAVDHVAAIGHDPSRWRDGHDAFDRVRDLTLREEKARTADLYRALLYVAEIVAKIIYNASGSPAPFDHDSPWWLASNARHFTTCLGQEPVSRAVWSALAGDPRG